METRNPVLRELILYGTVGCHLCEEAEALLDEARRRRPACPAVSKIDIAADDRLTERYGIRIPVLHDSATSRELGWPFDTVHLLAFLDDLA
jgi:hypothetical protein